MSWIYRAEEGIVDRLSFPTPYSIMSGYSHFHSKCGYIACTNGVCCEFLGKRFFRAGTPILIYEGMGADYDILPWVFGRQVYEDLLRIEESYEDFHVTAISKSYQLLDIAPARKCRWKKWDERTKDEIESYGDSLYSDIASLIGKEYPDAVIINLMGKEKDSLGVKDPAKKAPVKKKARNKWLVHQTQRKIVW